MDLKFLIGDEWDMLVEYDYVVSGYNVYLRRRLRDGSVKFLQSRNGQLIEQTIDPEEHGVQHDIYPAFVLGDAVAKALVEALTNEGVRPDQEARNEGELEATKRHLADLQEVFKVSSKSLISGED
jgi:hypothetical protein